MSPQRLDIGKKTLVMGVLNVTPDSFSDGGKFLKKAYAVSRGLEMVREGADIIDIGGESTRPGSAPVSEAEEISRVIPVVASLAGRTRVPISVDTRKSKVAAEALSAGASIINDISALTADPEMAGTIAKYRATAILMHMRGEPGTMQIRPAYSDLIGEISASLKSSIRMAMRAGVKKENILIDPGIGFGKTVRHNLEILRRLGEFKALGCPICIGVSRKSFIGKILDIKDPAKRLAGSLAGAVAAIMNGASVLRAHDINATVEVARIVDGMLYGRIR